MPEEENAAQEPVAEVSMRKSAKRLNIVIECAYSGNLAKLQDCIADEDSPYHDRVKVQMNSQDEDGRSPVEIAAAEGHLEAMKFLIERGSEKNTLNPKTGKSPLQVACILGREDIVRELLANGVNLNMASLSGYTALHHASAWDHHRCIQLLINAEADLDAKTSHGERPRDVAARYKHAECAAFLDLSEARRNLKSLIRETKEVIEDPQKLQGRLAKDEKLTALNACAEKNDWLDSPGGQNIKDVERVFDELIKTLEPIQVKLAEPPPEKPQRK